MKTLPNRSEIQSWLKMSWTRIGAFFQKLREHKRVDEAVTQVQQRLGPELQRIRDDERVKDAVSKFKPYRGKVMAGCVLLILAWLIVPSGSDPKSATINYWKALEKISREEFAPDDQGEKDPPSQLENIRALDEIHARINKAQSRIHSLPIAHVDADLLVFAHRTLEVMQKLDMLLVKGAHFAKEANSENESLVSIPQFVKHALRGYSGDFTSSFNEMDKLKGERKARFQALMSDKEEFEREFNKLRSDQLPLKALLTKRYGVEF